MSMIAVCDGCGEQAPAACYHGQWFKPASWYERTPLDAAGRQQRTVTACSRACIDKIAEIDAAQGKDPMRVILPI